MRYLPVDVSSFKEIVKNYIYVDKTEYIYNLFSSGGRYYFLSRPRRFGKTLLISTLKELFEGNREAFYGLKINQYDYDWKKHPVILLDFASLPHSNKEELISSINWELNRIATTYNIDVSDAPSIGIKFKSLIIQLAQKEKVVVLVDEYDKPILDHLHNINEAEAQRDVLRSFFDILKGLDGYLRAIFITGVSKFSKTSIFSGINNLNDISLDKLGTAILGYTQNEIEYYFSDSISEMSKEINSNSDEIIKSLTHWYNGYRFSASEIKVYNPYSVIYCLLKKQFANYWFESGTPFFLVNLIRKQYYKLEDLQFIDVDLESLGSFDVKAIPLIQLLFQTGYLTIKEYSRKTDKYNLGYPNHEVEQSFTKYLIATLAAADNLMVDTAISKLIKALNENSISDFCRVLTALFAQIPYTINKPREDYYHSLFQLLMSLISPKHTESNSEILTNIGRIDSVVETENYLYLFELKVNSDPEVALKQIEDKKYYERYLLKDKKIILVGLAFNVDEDLEIKCKSKEL